MKKIYNKFYYSEKSTIKRRSHIQLRMILSEINPHKSYRILDYKIVFKIFFIVYNSIIIKL